MIAQSELLKMHDGSRVTHFRKLGERQTTILDAKTFVRLYGEYDIRHVPYLAHRNEVDVYTSGGWPHDCNYIGTWVKLSFSA